MRNVNVSMAAGKLVCRLSGTGLFDVDDANELTVYADYELPKGLRSLGILVYDASLAEKVDGKRLVEKNSLEELEIRHPLSTHQKCWLTESMRLGQVAKSTRCTLTTNCGRSRERQRTCIISRLRLHISFSLQRY